jgi:hypothetical protein
MIQLITDHSYRAVQANALENELKNFSLKRTVTICCGLDAVDRAVVKKGDSFLLSIGDPLKLRENFDALILPNHEPMPEHKNIIPITGLLNEMSPENLRGHGDEFEHFPHPRVAVMLGGRHVGGDVSQADVDAILAGAQGAKLVTTSRRSNDSLKIDADFAYNFNRDGQDANPYLAMLASAEAVLVTADSARMMSEACSSGKAVYIYSPQMLHFSYAALRDKLVEGGYARDFAEIGEEIRPTKLLSEAKRVAEIIANQL